MQTFYSKKEIKTKYLNHMKDQQNRNPSFSYTFLDDDGAYDFLKDHKLFPKETAETFKQIPPVMGAMKADLLRYAWLYFYGGVYADIDVNLTLPILDWIHKNDTYICLIDDKGQCKQNVIACSPNHYIMWHCLKKSLHNVINNQYADHGMWWGTLEATGPILLNNVVKEYEQQFGGTIRRVKSSDVMVDRIVIGDHGQMYKNPKERYYFQHKKPPNLEWIHHNN
jgi:mannosyltransferase OCH1-like enzyme